MIADAGFEVEGAGTTTLPEHRGAGCAPCGGAADGGDTGAVPSVRTDAAPAESARRDSARTDLVAVRRRGAGTDLAPNA